MGAIAAIGFTLAAIPNQAKGFVLMSDFNNGTPSDYSDDLLDAPRWSNVPGSFVEDGVRGLGGGVEYMVSPDFCDRLIPRFVDPTPPSCVQLEATVQKMLDAWSSGSPALSFVNVTDKVALDPDRFESLPELIVLTMEPADFEKFSGTTAVAVGNSWSVEDDPIGTSGHLLPGNSIISSYVVFDTDACYFFDPALLSTVGNECSHFSTVMLHEIGHTLGLGHPNQFPKRNFVRRSIGADGLDRRCDRDPAQNYKLQPGAAPDALMNSASPRVQVALAPDDLEGLRFLYPICNGGS